MQQTNNRKQKKKQNQATVLAIANVPKAAPSDIVTTPARKTPTTNNSYPRRRRNPSGNGGVPRPMRMSANHTRHHVQTCSVLDPFCPHASGARYPDGNLVPTITYSSRWLQAIATSSTGFNSVVISPDISDYNLMYGAAPTNPNLTIGDAGLTTVVTNWERARIVSAGAIIHFTYPDTSAKPMVVVSEIQDGSDLNGGAVITALNLSTSSGAKLIPTDQPFFWVCKSTNRDNRVFVQRAVANATTRTREYNALRIDVNGVAATTYGFVEVFINYEYTATSASSVQTYAAKPPAAAPVATKSANDVLGTLGVGQSSASPDIFSQFLADAGAKVVDTMLSVGSEALLAALA